MLIPIQAADATVSLGISMPKLLNDPNVDQKVMDAVLRRSPYATNIRVVNLQKTFLRGALFTVAFEGAPEADGAVSTYTNRVYVHGVHTDVYGHDEALLNVVGQTHVSGPFEMLANTKIVAGLIALVMTIAIVFIVSVGVYRGVDIGIPTLLSNGWLLILGFYFGKLESKE